MYAAQAKSVWLILRRKHGPALESRHTIPKAALARGESKERRIGKHLILLYQCKHKPKCCVGTWAVVVEGQDERAGEEVDTHNRVMGQSERAQDNEKRRKAEKKEGGAFALRVLL